jgi:hypothetical protein
VDHRPCKKCKLTEVSGGQSSLETVNVTNLVKNWPK